MAMSKRRGIATLGILLFVILLVGVGTRAKAAGNVMGSLVGGVATILRPVNGTAEDVINATAKQLNISFEVEPEEEHSDLVMANVKNALNVREEPDEDADRAGKLYKDCGGTILERGEEWTKIQSGNLIGWCSNEYLLFDDEAEALAQDVGITLATVNTETLRVRDSAGTSSSVLGLVPKGEVYEVIDEEEDENGNAWVCIDYEGEDGYVSAEYVTTSFQIDSGETMEEIKTREAAEKEAKRHVNYGEYTTDADTTLLLAALIQCEAGGETYEGQVAVGAVVMNRVRSSAYPDSIHGVIYASGQFTPAMNGKVNKVYESGKIYSSCIKAAEDALSGTSNVGDCTHFRRNNGRDGIVIGHHVFY